MIVSLTSDHPPLLTDVERLDRLHATCGSPVDQLDLGTLCRPGPDDEHVWLSIPGARRAGSESTTSPTFGTDFDAMVAYATTKGWVDDSGDWVRAHIQPPTPPTRPT